LLFSFAGFLSKERDVLICLWLDVRHQQVRGGLGRARFKERAYVSCRGRARMNERWSLADF
jgi:hypothetical protein